MRSNQLYAVFFSLMVLLLPVSCNLSMSQGGKSEVSITLPGGISGGARAIKVPVAIQDEMRYELTFTGPGAAQTRGAVAGETITVSLELGHWTIRVTAFYQYDEKEMPAGEGSMTIHVRAGQNNQAAITMSVLDDFVRPGKPIDDAVRWRLWTTEASSISAYDNYIIEPNAMTYQWYITTENSNEDGVLITDAIGEELVLNFTETIMTFSPETTRYFYCEITHEFGVGEGAVSHTGYTKPIGIYPPNSQGLQAWIDDADWGEEIYLPPGFGPSSLAEIYMDSTVVVDKDITLYPRSGGTKLRREFPKFEGGVGIVDGTGHRDDMFIVRKGTLTLAGTVNAALELQGYSNTSGFANVVCGSLVKVEQGGTLVMESHVRLYENYAANGGGVHIAGGTFTMYDGIIGHNGDFNQANKGGGVYIGEGGTFIMTGGNITGSNQYFHEPKNGGGVYVADAGAFFMSGGEISNNNADNGGGVYIENGGNFDKQSGGGGISENTVGIGGSGSQAFYANGDRYRDDPVNEGGALSTGNPDDGWEQ